MALQDIDTIVILMMENRSFDQMLGYLSLPDTPSPMPVNGLRDDASWRAARANVHDGKVFPLKRLPWQTNVEVDPPHDSTVIHHQINTPPADASLRVMGGFVTSYSSLHDPKADLSLAMGYYDHTTVTVLDFLARQFVVCDRWFSSLPTGTQPNRLMAMAGESTIKDNRTFAFPDQPLVYDWLSARDVDWCVYQSGGFLPFFALNKRMLPGIIVSLTRSQLAGDRVPFRRFSRFAAEWKSPKPMPQVIFIEPEYGDGPSSRPNDDHPTAYLARGQALMSDVYKVLISNPARWARTMLIITYDEHGGFFDHEPPLPIPTTVGGWLFPTTGVRVPAVVVCPQAPAGRVFSDPLDHTSILQLLADRFDPGDGYSPAVTARQTRLGRLADILDPAPAAARAPKVPAVAVVQQKVAAAISPTAPLVGPSPDDPPNARALHKALVQAAADHPAALSQPGWEDARAYLAKAAVAGLGQ